MNFAQYALVSSRDYRGHREKMQIPGSASKTDNKFGTYAQLVFRHTESDNTEYHK